MHHIGLLFPHQLFVDHPMFTKCEVIYFVEEYLYFQQYPFHKQKLAFHRATMQAFAEELAAQGHRIEYISSQEEIADIRQLLPALAEKYDVKALHVIDPTDYWLMNRIEAGSQEHNLNLVTYENPLFLNTTTDLQSFFTDDKDSFFQTAFYREQRKKRNILLAKDGKPMGGKWSFDAENRKKYPKGKTPPSIEFPAEHKQWAAAKKYVNEYFADNYGELSDSSMYPLTHEAAQTWLQQFLEVRFHDFGTYEDAIVQQEAILHHSVLSPLINVGLLPVQDVLDQSIDYAKSAGIPINSTEGFVRQIIGWREFIRGMYECKGRWSRTRNFWDFTRKIPDSFYHGTTGILPIDTTIKKVLQTGYAHHIERLMVLGNFMLLCEFDPDAVYQWFMELFIDAYDWVMVPNVYSMSQYADGGLFATKPYISGSNYLKKMSDYPSGPWQPIWDGLFWRFIDRYEEFFRENPRTGVLLYSYNRMSAEKKRQHLQVAEEFLASLD